MFFVAQTLPGWEYKIKREFENVPDFNKLAKVHIISRLTEVTLENDNVDEKMRNQFPEYIFLEMEKEGLGTLKSLIDKNQIRGLLDILHSGTYYVPLTDVETDELGLTGQKKLRKGSKVIITVHNGFEDEEGKIVKIDGKDYYVLVEEYTLKLREGDFAPLTNGRKSK